MLIINPKFQSSESCNIQLRYQQSIRISYTLVSEAYCVNSLFFDGEWNI